MKNRPAVGYLGGADLDALRDVQDELRRARSTYDDFASPHEGYAILLEEVQELWAEVMKKPSQRDRKKLYAEACQVSAMALRFMVDSAGQGKNAPR